MTLYGMHRDMENAIKDAIMDKLLKWQEKVNVTDGYIDPLDDFDLDEKIEDTAGKVVEILVKQIL